MVECMGSVSVGLSLNPWSTSYSYCESLKKWYTFLVLSFLMYTNDAVTKIHEALNSVPYTQQTE